MQRFKNRSDARRFWCSGDGTSKRAIIAATTAATVAAISTTLNGRCNATRTHIIIIHTASILAIRRVQYSTISSASEVTTYGATNVIINILFCGCLYTQIWKLFSSSLASPSSVYPYVGCRWWGCVDQFLRTLPVFITFHCLLYATFALVYPSFSLPPVSFL